MVKRIPTIALAAGVAALGALDWCVAGSTAAGPKDREKLAAPKPSSLPAAADLETPLATAGFRGLDARLERHGERGYALRITNPGTARVACGYEVQAWETSGVSVGRRGPRPQQRATQKLELSVAPGTSVLQVLRYQDPQPQAPAKLQKALSGGRAFRSLEFRIVQRVRIPPKPGHKDTHKTVNRTVARLRVAGTPNVAVQKG